MSKQPEKIASPCRNICELDTTQTICVGCYRSLGEIGEWSKASNHRKREIVEAAAKRQSNTANE